MTDDEKNNLKADKKGKKDENPSPPPPVAKRPDPTRYGDWEINGKCIDF